MIEAIGGAVPAAQSGAGSDAAKVKDAATAFEALLIAQLLKSAREAETSGALGSEDESQAGSSMLEIAHEQLAQTLAKQGGLGVARLVVEGLGRKE